MLTCDIQICISKVSLSRKNEGYKMDTKTVLTGFLGEPISRPELVAVLDEVGLELWQAPEGFWAIRAKRATSPAQPAGSKRRRRSEGNA